MRAAELVGLASAHGVDLVQAARLSAVRPPRRVIHRRAADGHSYEVLQAPNGREANGRSSRSFERPSWSLAELGQAAAGVPRLQFLAACFTYAGDRSGYWQLWSALERDAQALRVRYHWPAQVRGAAGAPVFYLEQLAQLVLDEDEHSHLFQSAPVLYSIYAGVDEQTWRRSVFERFDQVKLRFLGWIGEAMSTMQPRLNELAGDSE
jgi:hypothetical protein